MTSQFETRLGRLARMPDLLDGALIGIEKESLRVSPDGYISATPHPDALGSALSNKFITTDYSEALLELVTAPMQSSLQAIQFLCDIHAFVCEALGDDILWPLSMPCMIRSEKDIPLARYGKSNIGQMKTIYRRGLGYRYGRYMQAIAGIHFNYSLPLAFWPEYQSLCNASGDVADFRSREYFGLTRNVRRLDWLLLYVFGSSPAVCKSFMRDREPNLDSLDDKTYFGPHATSLRMSDIGYQNESQSELYISANSLGEYIDGLVRATRTPSPEFEKIGLQDGERWLQLSANKLQIENEYYSTIRPKRVAKSGEHPSEALRRGGVEYVELRALDVSPFDPVGINSEQMRFLEVYLIYCLLDESLPIDESERLEHRHNRGIVARRGREPGLRLRRRGEAVPLLHWGQEVCEQMLGVAELLDTGRSQDYRKAVLKQQRVLDEPDQAPSSRLLAELRNSGQSLFEFGLSQGHSFREYFDSLGRDMNQHRELLIAESAASLKKQAEIEAADDVGFDEYLRRYFS